MVQDKYELNAKVAATAHITPSRYQEWYKQSIEHPESFWADQAKKYLSWSKLWRHVYEGDFSKGENKWFVGGELNASYNCLDRHLASKGKEIALIWESDSPNVSKSLTYAELYERVCRFANVLKRYGVKKGDRVCIYLPMIPEAVIAMLACARIGAIHSVVFAGFSAQSLQARIQDSACKLVITANEGVRGNKFIPLKEQVDLALRDCPLVSTVIVVKRTEKDVIFDSNRDVWYHNAIANAAAECAPETMSANDPLFILYTSGSTGKPKGILHGTGGYLLYVAMTHKILFDYHKHEIFWCTADVGWITGHSYSVYGPLLNGATTVIFEGVPSYPTSARFWQIVDKHKVNIFYTAPTVIRALRREGEQWVQQTSRRSLRILGTVGEPINSQAWEWYYQVVGESRCPIVDTWWQTETGGILISPFPGATPLKAASAGWPFFGIAPQIVDEAGKVCPANTMGRLVITKPWPGMMQTIYKDQERFLATYMQTVPGCYLTGDQAYQDEEGYYFIAGRSDDVIKVSGHRIGTEEVESALLLHPAISEAAVVAVPDSIKGQAIYAFVHLKANARFSPVLHQELAQQVRTAIGAISTPDYIQFVEGLPKTRSGKIMRRLLRLIAVGDTDELGDLSTLADPSVIDALIANRLSLKQ